MNSIKRISFKYFFVFEVAKKCFCRKIMEEVFTEEQLCKMIGGDDDLEKPIDICYAFKIIKILKFRKWIIE